MQGVRGNEVALTEAEAFAGLATAIHYEHRLASDVDDWRWCRILICFKGAPRQSPPKRTHPRSRPSRSGPQTPAKEGRWTNYSSTSSRPHAA